MREIRPLTTLRALAALLVFLYHYAVLHAPGGGAGVPLRQVWAHGYMGVPIFFVLSGFLLTRLYFDALADRAVTLRLFFVKRIARIWPLFLLLATVQHLGGWLLGRTTPAVDWLVTLTMSQGWFADLLYSGLAPAWSLTIEETFYALVPVVCLVIGRLAFPDARPLRLDRQRWLRLGGALAVIVVALAAAGEAGWRLARALGLAWAGFLGGRDHVLRMTLCGRMPEFALGIAAAFVHRDGRLVDRLGPRRAGWLAVGLALAIGGLLALKETAPPGGQYLVHNGAALAAAGLTLTLCVPGHAPARLLAAGPLVYLGRISYGFYLLQLSLVSEPLVAIASRCGAWRVPVLFALFVAVCAGLYETVERPARRALVARWGGTGRAAGG